MDLVEKIKKEVAAEEKKLISEEKERTKSETPTYEAQAAFQKKLGDLYKAAYEKTEAKHFQTWAELHYKSAEWIERKYLGKD